jgi:hypothetical protein
MLAVADFLLGDELLVEVLPALLTSCRVPLCNCFYSFSTQQLTQLLVANRATGGLPNYNSERSLLLPLAVSAITYVGFPCLTYVPEQKQYSKRK